MATKHSRSEPAASGAVARTKASSATRKAPQRVTPEVYNAFIAGLDLVSVRLAGADIRAASTPERRQLLPAVEQSARFTHQDEHVVVTHELTFAGSYEDDDDPAVFIRAEFEVRYSTAERMTPGIFAEFRRRNLPLNTWPYFREFVHAVLARTGWPVFVLPVYKAVGAPLSASGE